MSSFNLKLLTCFIRLLELSASNCAVLAKLSADTVTSCVEAAISSDEAEFSSAILAVECIVSTIWSFLLLISSTVEFISSICGRISLIIP